MYAWLAKRPLVGWMLATAIAAVAVIVIAHVTGADAIGRAFSKMNPPWIALLAVAELITYPAYALAFRSIACIHGHAPLGLPLVSRVVVAGFGPFAIGGGFGLDKRLLAAIHEDERSATVRVLALGTLEWAVLAPIASVIAIVLLATHADVMPSLLWPWAIAVPLGFALALRASSKPGWILKLSGKHRDRLRQGLEGIGVLHSLLRHPYRYRGAWLGTALYWAADITAFYAALRLFGLNAEFGKVIIAYGTGYAATRRSLPLGGAGVTEALMTYSLYWIRLPLAPALAAVLAYRVFNFLLVSAPALVAHQQLRPWLEGHLRLPRPNRPEM